MSRLVALTLDTARGTSGRLLRELAGRGPPGEMVSTMAHSPAVQGGYLDLNRYVKRVKLARRHSELISIAVQARLGCTRCLEAHDAGARAVGLDEDDIRPARAGTAREPADAAAVAFGLQAYTNPGAIPDADLAELRVLGFSDREIADVVAIVTLNVLTGTFNLVSGLSTPLSASQLDADTP